MTRAAASSRLLSVLMVLVTCAGCGARTEYGISDVRIDRYSWDSLAVVPEFTSSTTIGGVRRLQPDELAILVFDAAYDTLYAGAAPSFRVDDAALGDEEPVVIELCGRLGARWICTQQGMRASPKRVSIRENIVYPVDASYTRGRFSLDARVERRRFDGDGWEEIDFKGAIQGYVEASVEGGPEETVRIPLTSTSGQFDLSRLENYNEFRFYLDSRLMDEQAAEVRFDVYGGIGERVDLLATVTKPLTVVTPEERLANARGFARQTARLLVRELSSFFGSRRTMASVDAWHFDRESGRYEIAMSFSWRGSFFDHRDYRIEGELRVAEDGGDAHFAVMDGNRSGVARWSDRFRSTEVSLGTLEVERPARRYTPGRPSARSYY